MAADRRGGLAAGPEYVLATERARLLSFGYPIHRFGRIDSTQSIARRLADEGADEGTLVTAREQTGGRGRLGNTFFSPPGGLYVSLILRPALSPSQTPLIGLAAGLAAAETIRDATTLQPLLKWPNDVLIGDRKVCGVLVDLAATQNRVRWAVVGMGLNLNVMEFPPYLRTTATSLAIEVGHELDIDRVRVKFLAQFEMQYNELSANGPEALLAAWHSTPSMLGKIIRISIGSEEVEGVAEGLDADGRLLLRLADGAVRGFSAGQVHLI